MCIYIMANPSGNGTNSNDAADSGFHGGSSVPEPVLQHNPGVSTDWTPDEESILEDGLAQYGSEPNIIRYAKIAVQLQNKTVRDVALRCRWMFKRDISKRRKDDYIMSRKIKDRKEKMNELLASSSQCATQSGSSSNFHGDIANSKPNDIIHSVLMSPEGQLLKESAQALERVSANLGTHQVFENITLLCQVRECIRDVLNNLDGTPEKVKQMPPLPEKLNEDLLNKLIPHATLQRLQ